MYYTIVCEICGEEIHELWEILGLHTHWTPPERNTARQEERPGLKERAQRRMPHLGWLRTRKR